jgi:hypothetical protein
MKILPIVFCLGTGCLSLPVQAGVVNGGLESGDLTGWSSLGDVAATDSSFGTGPAAGSYQALLTTANTADTADGYNFSGNDAADGAALETFLQLPNGTLDAIEGSGLSQSFTANAGDVLSFEWNFLTDILDNTGFDDFAFFVLDGAVFSLASTSSSLHASNSVFNYETGFSIFSQILNGGSHTLSFGVVDVGDGLAVSTLLIDGVTLSPQVIPEP